MGNRAVITTKENFDNNGIGIYVHWNGGRDSIEAFLKYCKLAGYRPPDKDCYGWAYLTRVITNFFNDGLSCGIDTVKNLDCDNCDNGTYFIEDWEIVGRKFSYGDVEVNTEELISFIEELESLNGKLPNGWKDKIRGDSRKICKFEELTDEARAVAIKELARSDKWCDEFMDDMLEILTDVRRRGTESMGTLCL